MKQEISYIAAAFVVYGISGLFVSYVSLGKIDLLYLLFWTIGMTLADYFIIRKLRNTFKKKI